MVQHTSSETQGQLTRPIRRKLSRKVGANERESGALRFTLAYFERAGLLGILRHIAPINCPWVSVVRVLMWLLRFLCLFISFICHVLYIALIINAYLNAFHKTLKIVRGLSLVDRLCLDERMLTRLWLHAVCFPFYKRNRTFCAVFI